MCDGMVDMLDRMMDCGRRNKIVSNTRFREDLVDDMGAGKRRQMRMDVGGPWTDIDGRGVLRVWPGRLGSMRPILDLGSAVGPEAKQKGT